MNEVTVIHLGRQSFTISVAAHKVLKAYLHDIEQHAGKDVGEEVELRMAELLSEHGISGEKVVLEKDIDYLKEQLGSPTDFAEDEEPDKKPPADSDAPKRLYRDTDNAMVAGVASGLAAYLNIDPIIVRLIFVAATLAGGWGIAVYILLWLLVPEAKTSSERLKMRGKAVTVDTLKEAVTRADIPAATQRATNIVAKIFTVAARILMGIIGVALTTIAGCMIFAAVAGGIYILGHHGQVSGQSIFPIGSAETALLAAAVITVVTISAVLSLIGGAMLSLKWRTPGWVLAALAGLFIVSAGTTAALAADAAPRIRDRFEALHHSQTIKLPKFASLHLSGHNAKYTFVPDQTYFAEVSYIGSPRDVRIPAKVDNGVLNLDLKAVTNQKLCDWFCFYNDRDLHVTIHAPSLDTVAIDGGVSDFAVNEPLQQDNITVTAQKESNIDFMYAKPQIARLTDNGPTWTVELIGLDRTAAAYQTVHTDEEQVFITSAGNIEAKPSRQCDLGETYFYIMNAPQTLKINDKTIDSPAALRGLQTEMANVYNCVVEP